MVGLLLNTGKLQDYEAIGEGGQPVYAVALQLRDVIQTQLGDDYADYLAIPRPNENGVEIDWYSPISLPLDSRQQIIKNCAAISPEERDRVRHTLQAAHVAVCVASTTLQGSDTQEKQLVQKLLNKVFLFPETGTLETVFLVDDKPVITFWGFVNRQDKDTGSVFMAQSAIPATKATPAPPLAVNSVKPAAVPFSAMTPASPVKKDARPWWHWLLLALALLGLLLLLLRSCVPSIGVPGLPGKPTISLPTITEKLPSLSLPDLKSWWGTRGFSIPGFDSGKSSVVSPVGSSGPISQVAAGGNGKLAMPVAPDAVLEADKAAAPTVPPPAPGNIAPPDASLPQMASGNAAAPPLGLSPSSSASSNGLVIPPGALANGSADFLNGSWSAGAGIQDVRTGKPIRLNYDFNNGQGKVAVQRGDGIECTDTVGASIQGSSLYIDKGMQATCSDGSTYALPNITCSAGVEGKADCQGKYENGDSFPVLMRHGSQQ